MRAYEDFLIGDENTFGNYTVSKEEIIAFAVDYDPQPHHLDEDAAKESILGGLAASGWHTCALINKLIVEDDLKDVDVLGMPTVHEVRWKKPLFPNDTLTISRRMTMKTPELGYYDRGRCRFTYTVTNQRDQEICTMEADVLMKRGENIY